MFLVFLCVNTAIHMNDMFNQQQAKTHKEVVEKKRGQATRYSRKNRMNKKNSSTFFKNISN